MTISYSQAAREIKALGFTCRRVDDEIRVSWPNNESAAYYTDCPDDALNTARAMAKETAPNADMVTVQHYDLPIKIEVEIASLEVIGTHDGVTYYEHPTFGDESPLQLLIGGELVNSDFWDMDSVCDFEPATFAKRFRYDGKA